MNYREASGKLLRLGCREIPRRAGGSNRKWENSTTGQVTFCRIGEGPS